ncbi:MAG: hypothetical protein M1831_006119 [Alyxoria varia]|nr:MAG: hypothetical protein M1831_006119 [Alyxoria varia]
MTLLDTHLEQIELCANTISDLPFLPPKTFTNAMLHAPDITALIRDTEAHERALFSLAPRSEATGARNPSESSAPRSTAFDAEGYLGFDQQFKAPRSGTAVASILGGNLDERIKREYGRETQDSWREKRGQKDDIDVELLLNGAEKLCGIYPITGVSEKISSLRTRNAKVMASLQRYEDLVSEQATQLGKMNRSSNFAFGDDELDDLEHDPNPAPTSAPEEGLAITQEELKMEEEACAELERKKQTLEERVTGMEKDLGGLMR